MLIQDLHKIWINFFWSSMLLATLRYHSRNLEPVWYVYLNNNFQFFFNIRMSEKVCENTCNVV